MHNRNRRRVTVNRSEAQTVFESSTGPAFYEGSVLAGTKKGRRSDPFQKLLLTITAIHVLQPYTL